VGTLTTTDPDNGNTFTYTLVTGTGSTDNASFTIATDVLKTAASFDFETKSTYSIRVRSLDQGGLFTEKVFTITVTDVNEAPSITSSGGGDTASIKFHRHDVVATDPDANATLTYSITGGADAGKFSINSTPGSK
jgi:VCBS repeat-containing protein